MSRKVATLVYSRRIGSMARKAILAYCADRANDDGSAVFCSKVTIAEEVECSKQTVIDTLRAFVDEGLMVEVGRVKCSNGYTVRYDMRVEAIEALPKADEGVQNWTPRGPKVDRSKIGRVKPVDPTGQATGPHGVKPVDPNRPVTVLEPPKEESARDALADVVGAELADAFVAHRKALRSPMTPHAGKLMAKKLAAMSDPGASVEQSITRGWKDVFPVKAEVHHFPSKRQNDAERLDDYLDELKARVAVQRLE